MALWQTTKDKNRALDMVRMGLVALKDEPSKFARKLYIEGQEFLQKHDNGS